MKYEMYKHVLQKLQDIYDYLKNKFMSFNFQYVFICHVKCIYAFTCRLKWNEIYIPVYVPVETWSWPSKPAASLALEKANADS